MVGGKPLKIRVPERIRVTDADTPQGLQEVLPIFEAGLYQRGRLEHHGLLRTYDARIFPMRCEIEITHPGLEIGWSPSTPPMRKIRGRVLTPGRDRVVIHNGREWHTEIYRDRHEAYRGIVISEDVINELGFSAENLHFAELEHFLAPKLHEGLDLLGSLRSALPSGREASDCLASSLAACLLTDLSHNQMAKIPALRAEKSLRQNVVRIKSAMGEMFREKELNLDELARHCQMTKFELIRNFRKGTGETPAKYLAKFRMGMAIAWIRGTNRPISDIALELGYNDFSSFSRAFLRVTGRQPSSYRSY